MRHTVTAGQKSDYGQANFLASQDRCTQPIADRGYDSNGFRNMLFSSGIQPIIPGRRNRKVAIVVDPNTYKKRNVIERFFARVKEFRRIAARYEKTVATFGAMFTIGCILVLLKV
jgi:transposase